MNIRVVEGNKENFTDQCNALFEQGHYKIISSGRNDDDPGTRASAMYWAILQNI